MQYIYIYIYIYMYVCMYRLACTENAHFTCIGQENDFVFTAIYTEVGLYLQIDERMSF
jgi:hypothetical protein